MTTFIKTLSYDTRGNGVDDFSYVTRLLLHEIDPPSNAQACFFIPADSLVLYSSHRRVSGTVNRLSAAYIESDALREIAFDLRQFCSEREWKCRGSVAVREAFKEAFIVDKLTQKREELFGEIVEVLNKIRDEHITHVISHSFRLKLIEAYVLTKGKIAKDPALIHLCMSSENKTYPFGGRFSIIV